MSRYPAERHNDEFIKLFALFRSKPEHAELTQQDAMVAVSELLGVTPWAVKSWVRPEGGRSAYACPKHRVDAFKVALGLKLADLNESQRKRVMEMLNIQGVRR